MLHAKETMTRDVITVGPETSLREAARLMELYRIRHLVVVVAGHVLGVLSDRDVLRHSPAVQGKAELVVPELPVREVMTAEPLTTSPQSTVGHVAGLMLDHKIDAVPVVRPDGQLLGLITSSDLLELLRERDRAEGKIIPFDFRLRGAAA